MASNKTVTIKLSTLEAEAMWGLVGIAGAWLEGRRNPDDTAGVSYRPADLVREGWAKGEAEAAPRAVAKLRRAIKGEW